MINLSAQIESGLNTVLEGLNYDIELDYKIKDESEYKSYSGYNIQADLKSGGKIAGVIKIVNDSSLDISFNIKEGAKYVPTTKTINFKNIRAAKVFEEDSALLEPDKMQQIINSKTTSFDSAKKILTTWMASPNAPSKVKVKEFLEKLATAGDKSIKFLRNALAHEIDYDALEVHKHHNATKAKPLILIAIMDMDNNVRELKEKIENNQLSLVEQDFKLGYPERFANGEFFDVKKLWKTPLKKGSVKICPYGTEGETIVLTDLEIILPAVPKNKKDILFSDLPKEEQYWRREELPDISLEGVDSFSDFIKKEFKRRVEGVWFMNNGVPTYMTGHMYFTLKYFQMLDDGDYMAYREAQRDMFYHIQACIVDPRCLGQLFGKSRRTGFTYCILGVLANWATSRKNAKFGMMSKTGADSSEAFMKLAYGIRALPFWFKPIIQGKEDTTSGFTFSAPADNSKEAKKKKKGNVTDYLNTVIDWRSTSDGSYDSIKLNGYLLDEAFKIERPNDVITHLGQIAPTMMPNNGTPIGTMFAGSTMGSHAKGGSQGIELIKNSQIVDRDEITGKTTTGLYFHFLPAQLNMEEFTDMYGKCHTERPPVGTLNVKGEEIVLGSIEFLIATEAQKKRQGDKAYNEQLRTYPRTLDHMLRDESSNCEFNATKLQDQIDHNEWIDEEDLYMTGNFEWVNEKDGDVGFYPNPNGRFRVKWLPSIANGLHHLANAVKKVGDKFYPLNKDMVRFGCDPFSIKATNGEGSKGAIHGKTLMFPDGSEDGVPCNDFVVEYIARPPDETIFFEDVIKVIRYYGSPILVESNRIDLLRHMRNRGYRPFSMNRLDKHESQLNPNEKEYGGQTMSSKDILDSHKNKIGSWIENYVGVSINPEIREEGEMGKMVFQETLKDWLKFDSAKRTKFDATISSGLAIMACSTEKYKGDKKERAVKKITFVKRYNNKGNIGTLKNYNNGR